MAHEPPNMAVMQYQLGQQQDAIDKLVVAVGELRVTSGNLLLIAQQWQTRWEEHEKMHNEEIKPRLQTIWDTRQQLSGGFSTMKGLLLFIAGILTALGTLWALIPKR